MTKLEHAAVLTGDLIASSKAGAAAVDAAMGVLADAAGTMPRWSGGDTRFTRFRGDGWQVLVADPAQSLRAALFLTARLRAHGTLATRIAVGIGAITNAGSRDLSDAAGGALEASGHALEDLPRAARLTLDAHSPAALRAAFALADGLARGWTGPQAEAIALMLDAPDRTQDDVAQQLGVSQPALRKRLHGGHYEALDLALRLLAA